MQNDKQSNNGSFYEKNNPDIPSVKYGDIEYYILPNNDNCTASWSLGNIEYFIVTNMSVSDLEDVIKSTY